MNSQSHRLPAPLKTSSNDTSTPGFEAQTSFQSRDLKKHMSLPPHASAPADVIITDIFIPDFDGIETIRELRRVAPGVKVIVVSGGDSTGTLNLLEDAKLLGADRAFHKPLKPEELLGAVREMLSENRQE